MEPQWEEVDWIIDTGSKESLGSEEHARSIPTIKSKETGRKYQVANGAIVENEGEKRMEIQSDEGQRGFMTVQVTRVTQPLLSMD